MHVTGNNYLHACFHNMHVTGNYMNEITCMLCKTQCIIHVSMQNYYELKKKEMLADDADGTLWSRGSHLDWGL